MLKLAGEFEIGREKVELLTYNPDKQDTGDLEAGTKTITATAEASGLGNADYSAALTLPAPSDARLAVKRICAKLSVNIAGLGTATHVYCRVYVDAQDADHRLFDEDWTSTGAKLDAVDKTSGTIFDLLTDGTSHTFYFFFWADVTNEATIDTVQLWEGVGSCGTGNAAYTNNCLDLLFTGLIEFGFFPGRIGSGSQNVRIARSIDGMVESRSELLSREADPTFQVCHLVAGHCYVVTAGTVSTDLNYIARISFVLRSEQ